MAWGQAEAWLGGMARGQAEAWLGGKQRHGFGASRGMARGQAEAVGCHVNLSCCPSSAASPFSAMTSLPQHSSSRAGLAGLPRGQRRLAPISECAQSPALHTCSPPKLPTPSHSDTPAALLPTRSSPPPLFGVDIVPQCPPRSFPSPCKPSSCPPSHLDTVASSTSVRSMASCCLISAMEPSTCSPGQVEQGQARSGQVRSGQGRPGR